MCVGLSGKVKWNVRRGTGRVARWQVRGQGRLVSFRQVHNRQRLAICQVFTVTLCLSKCTRDIELVLAVNHLRLDETPTPVN